MSVKYTTACADRRWGLVVEGGGIDPRPRQTKVFKTGTSGFPP